MLAVTTLKDFASSNCKSTSGQKESLVNSLQLVMVNYV